ncbi:MAG: cell envelope biogenesis protein TonB [Rhodothermaceae bacterium]|nr:MAG: cell envelope biogenesis protein TonB [Rhodothermaceae bacterium]
MMMALALALGVVYGVTQLPIYQMPVPVGWDYAARQYALMFEEHRAVEKEAPKPESGVPVTTFGRDEEEEPPEGKDEDAARQADEGEEARRLPDVPLERMVVAFADEMPTIRGGLGAYYINIEYPPEAIAAGIQGRLVLDFVVETDGRPTEIKVIQSLHPLCDSAAVRALRQTRFVPGRQNGKLVPVRMRLPVTFRLIDQEEAARRVAARDTARSGQ